MHSLGRIATCLQDGHLNTSPTLMRPSSTDWLAIYISDRVQHVNSVSYMVIHFINRKLQLTLASVLLKGGCALEIPEAASLRAVSQEVFKFSDIKNLLIKNICNILHYYSNAFQYICCWEATRVGNRN